MEKKHFTMRNKIILFCLLFSGILVAQTTVHGHKVKIKNIPVTTSLDTLLFAAPDGEIQQAPYSSVFSKLLADIEGSGSIAIQGGTNYFTAPNHFLDSLVIDGYRSNSRGIYFTGDDDGEEVFMSIVANNDGNFWENRINNYGMELNIYATDAFWLKDWGGNTYFIADDGGYGGVQAPLQDLAFYENLPSPATSKALVTEERLESYHAANDKTPNDEVYQFVFNDAVTGVPNSGEVRYDSANQWTTTELVFDFRTDYGQSSHWILSLEAGDLLYLQKYNDPAVRSYFIVTANTVEDDDDGFFTVGVSPSYFNSAFSNGDLISIKPFWTADRVPDDLGDITVGNIEMQKDSITVANRLSVISPDTYPALSIESISASHDQYLARMALKGYGDIAIEGNYYNASAPRGTKVSLRPGTGRWMLLSTEEDAAVDDGGTRMIYHSKDITAATYTISGFDLDEDQDDAGKVLWCNNASAQTITLPSSSDVPNGWNITIFQKGAGQVTVTKGVTDELRIPAGKVAKTRGQYSAVMILYDGLDFYITGDLDSI